MERLVLGGVDLSEEYEVVDVRRPVPSPVPNLVSVPGMDGYAFMGADTMPQPIRFTLVSKVMGYDERRREARQIAAVLNTAEPVEVAFSNDDGLYYVAVVSEPPDYREFVTFGAMTVTMQPLHSAMYGAERSVTVPSGGSVDFVVGGSYPTSPIVTATAVRGTSSLWGLILDELDFVHVATGSSSGRDVVLDCGQRTLTIQGSAAVPTLDSDWLRLSPGEHSLRMDNGTGAATVTWRERWL